MSGSEYYALEQKSCCCDACPRHIAPYICQVNCGCEEDCETCAMQCYEEAEEEIGDEE